MFNCLCCKRNKTTLKLTKLFTIAALIFSDSIIIWCWYDYGNIILEWPHQKIKLFIGFYIIYVFFFIYNIIRLLLQMKVLSKR